MQTSQVVQMSEAVQDQAVVTKYLTAPAGMSAELQAMAMLEQVMQGSTMCEEGRARVAVWFFDKYGA